MTTPSKKTNQRATTTPSKAPKPPAAPKEPPPSVEMFKSWLDDLRREYDRHAAHGSTPQKEAHCMREIERIQKELKEAHGVDY
jgi:hypothetical protein